MNTFIWLKPYINAHNIYNVLHFSFLIQENVLKNRSMWWFCIVLLQIFGVMICLSLSLLGLGLGYPYPNPLLSLSPFLKKQKRVGSWWHEGGIEEGVEAEERGRRRAQGVGVESRVNTQRGGILFLCSSLSPHKGNAFLIITTRKDIFGKHTKYIWTHDMSLTEIKPHRLLVVFIMSLEAKKLTLTAQTTAAPFL